MAQNSGTPKPTPTRPGPIAAVSFESAKPEPQVSTANRGSPVAPRAQASPEEATSAPHNGASPAADAGPSRKSQVPDVQPAAAAPDALNSSTNSNVINVFDEDQPPSAAVRPAAAHLNNVQALILGGCVAFVVLFPVIFGADSRLVDLLAFLTFIPAGIAFAYAFSASSRRVVTPINLWGKFAFGWLALLPAVLVTATILIVLGTIALSLISHITRNFYFFIIGWTLMMTFALVAVEETGKFLVTLKKDSFSNVENPRQFVLYSVFTSLGLATGETYYWVLFTRHLVDAIANYEAANTYSYDGSQYGGVDYFSGQSSYVHSTDGGTTRQQFRGFSVAAVAQLIGPSGVLWILISCVVIIVPMHVLSGYHVGLGIAYREVMKTRSSPVRSLLLPFVFRFVFLYIILWVPMISQIAWSGLTALALVPIYIWVVRRDELRMPRAYLNRAGYMNAFGYGVLGDNDDSDVPDLETHNQALPAVTGTHNGAAEASPHAA